LLCGTNKTYITSQNHGFAVDDSDLGKDWVPYFTNLNDGTNEGIKHISKPFFSTQFHPEASGGPTDTRFLFGDFMKLVRDKFPDPLTTSPGREGDLNSGKND
jgi:carbamoyl-phosphate synthase small subunit